MSDDRFDFRLERLLHLRERSEEEAGQAVAVALARVEALRDVEREVEQIMRQARTRILGAHVAPNAPGERIAVSLLLEQAQARLAEVRGQLDEAEADERACREALAARTQERRVLERLRDKHREEWRADAEHRARLAMDAIALRRAAVGTHHGAA